MSETRYQPIRDGEFEGVRSFILSSKCFHGCFEEVGCDTIISSTPDTICACQNPISPSLIICLQAQCYEEITPAPWVPEQYGRAWEVILGFQQSCCRDKPGVQPEYTGPDLVPPVSLDASSDSQCVNSCGIVAAGACSLNKTIARIFQDCNNLAPNFFQTCVTSECGPRLQSRSSAPSIGDGSDYIVISLVTLATLGVFLASYCLLQWIPATRVIRAEEPRPRVLEKLKTVNKPKIIRISRTDLLFHQVGYHFTDNWKLPEENKPSIHHIWMIATPDHVLQRYKNYRDRMESVWVRRRRQQRIGNEKLQYYGTRRTCKLGEAPGYTQFCIDALCILCRTIERSFDIDLCGREYSWGVYGNRKGIRTTPFSSQADADTTSEGSEFKAVLVCSVAVGQPCYFSQSFPLGQSQYCSAGFNSAVIWNSSGAAPYEETVVYENDAICARYLIIYK